jgi:hypothetical protein
LTISLGYFDFTTAMGQTPFYDDDPQGYTVDGNGN